MHNLCYSFGILTSFQGGTVEFDLVLCVDGLCSLCRFCHQLDFSTSGVLCVALNKAAAGRAYRCFKDRTVTKAYLALVYTHTHMRMSHLAHLAHLAHAGLYS